MNKLSFEARDGVAVLKLDNPPVNSLGHELREALVAGLERANADPAIKASVLIGSGAGFSGGADIRAFGPPKAAAYTHPAPRVHDSRRRLEPGLRALARGTLGARTG